jgi:hypothetical protein
MCFFASAAGTTSSGCRFVSEQMMTPSISPSA